jgi:hypothetical protein
MVAIDKLVKAFFNGKQDGKQGNHSFNIVEGWNCYQVKFYYHNTPICILTLTGSKKYIYDVCFNFGGYFTNSTIKAINCYREHFSKYQKK